MDRLVYAIYRGVAWIVRPFSIETIFRAGAFLGTLGYYLLCPYRRLVLHNLAIAFGTEKSREERRDLARRHFATLGANLLSGLKIAQCSSEELQSRITFEGIEMIKRAGGDAGGFVGIVSHIGNWELFAPIGPRLFDRKSGTIYQRLTNSYLDADVRRNRARLGLELFERKEGFAAAAQFIRTGGVCGVLVDQHAGDAGLWAPFFKRLASTSTLAATLALRTGTSLLPVATYTSGVARWRVTILPPIESQGMDVPALTARINEVLEQQVRHQPEEWFWVHNRWKTPRPKFLLATYKRGVVVPTGGASLQPFRMVIRTSNWLGDAVMSVPAVRAIKRGRPDAHVTVLTRARLREFWKIVPEVDEIIAIDEEASLFSIAAKLRVDPFDASIVFPNSFRVALEAWLARIPRRVGNGGRYRAALLNQIPRPRRRKAALPPRHQVYHYLALAEYIGADIDNIASMAGQPRAGNHTGPPMILGICPGAEYGPAKRWLPERFGEVMSILTERRACQWKLFGVAKDRPAGAAVLRAAAGVTCEDLLGRTTLSELIEQLRRCRLLVTNDTGTMHLAAHLGVPTVAIFGSTEPGLTAPLGTGHRQIRHHVECSPCFLRECPLDFRCMKAVATIEVVAAIEELLDQPAAVAG